MPSRLLFKPVVAVALVVGLGAAAYLTRSRWLPDSAGDERPSATAHDHDHHDHDHADGVKLSPQAQANLGLGVEPLVPETYTRMVPIPGTVVDRPGLSDRGVTAPVAGVITEVKVQPGTRSSPASRCSPFASSASCCWPPRSSCPRRPRNSRLQPRIASGSRRSRSNRSPAPG